MTEKGIDLPEVADTAADTSTGTEIAGIIVKEPVVPPGITDDEAMEIRQQVTELVSTLAEASGAREMELADDISNIGAVDRKSANSQMGLMRTRLGSMLDEDGPSKEIANGLQDLRRTLKTITLDVSEQPGIAKRTIRAIPFVGGRYNPVLRAINRIAIRYEPVSHQVTLIETRLLDGRTLLVRDNLELRKLYEEIELDQQLVRRDIYLGELLMRELTELIESMEDEVKQERLQNTLHSVAIRVQDKLTMSEVYGQAFVSIEMGRQNNIRLRQAVERTVSLATNVVTVGLAIQSALLHQKKVQIATERTRAFLGDLVAINAKAIKRHTEEIGDLYNNPVIAIEKLSQAHNDLIEALNTAGQLRNEGVEAARNNIARLAEMSGQLDEKVAALRGSPAVDTPVITGPSDQ